MDDFNYLVGIRKQMGFSFQNELHRKLPNATKCLTWSDVNRSHMIKDQKRVVQLEDIYGMMLLLAVGLSGAAVVLMLELLSKTLIRMHNQNKRAPGKPSYIP